MSKQLSTILKQDQIASDDPRTKQSTPASKNLALYLLGALDRAMLDAGHGQITATIWAIIDTNERLRRIAGTPRDSTSYAEAGAPN